MNNVEIGGFLHLFNRHGYVLDFSTSSFDAFTLDSVGVALCGKYELSNAIDVNKSSETVSNNYDEIKTSIKLLKKIDQQIAKQ